jgi:hypothetical protein
LVHFSHSGRDADADIHATLAALVIGLLIASAQSSFQTKSTQIKQITANVILLDNLVARSGAQAQPLRPLLRGSVKILVERIWREQNVNSAKAAPFEASAQSDLFFDKLLELTPQNDGQREMQTRALQIWIDLAQTRALFAQTDSAIPIVPRLKEHASQTRAGRLERHLGFINFKVVLIAHGVSTGWRCCGCS